MEIKGIDGLTAEDLEQEIANGAHFVIYEYAISIILASFKNPTAIYFVRSGKSRAVAGLPFTFLSLLLGWWGIPWGPIYTIQALITNLGGGKIVTEAVADELLPPQYAARVRPPSFPMPQG